MIRAWVLYWQVGYPCVDLWCSLIYCNCIKRKRVGTKYLFVLEHTIGLINVPGLGAQALAQRCLWPRNDWYAADLVPSARNNPGCRGKNKRLARNRTLTARHIARACRGNWPDGAEATGKEEKSLLWEPKMGWCMLFNYNAYAKIAAIYDKKYRQKMAIWRKIPPIKWCFGEKSAILYSC